MAAGAAGYEFTSAREEYACKRSRVAAVLSSRAELNSARRTELF